MIMENFLRSRKFGEWWKKVNKYLFQPVGKFCKPYLALKKEFELLAMKEGDKVDSFLGRTLMVVNKNES